MGIQDQNSDFNRSKHGGRVLAGLFLLLVGAVFLMKEMAFPFFPDWLFSWPMLLIAIGIYSGIKHEFRNPAWIILIVIGGVFLTDEMNIGFDFHRFIIPIIIIAVGFLMILRPRRRGDWRWDDWKQNNTASTAIKDTKEEYTQNYSSDDRFSSTSIFSGVKKVIVSKNFRGGDITCIMGGFEADMSKADMESPAVIEITHIFGGSKLIVPSNWLVKIDIVSLFAGVEDKRQQSSNTDPNKLLILKGTSIFGGIEVKSY
jgi:predicted membrane protein